MTVAADRIRSVIESCESRSLDDEQDREAVIEALREQLSRPLDGSARELLRQLYRMRSSAAQWDRAAGECLPPHLIGTYERATYEHSVTTRAAIDQAIEAFEEAVFR